MDTSAKADGVGSDGPPGNGAGDADPDPGDKLCGRSNPSKATPNAKVQDLVEYAAAISFAAALKANPSRSHHIASCDLDDEVCELRMHFHDRDNLERTMMLSDITFYNLVAMIETEGYGLRDYMYYVKDTDLDAEGMQEIEDDDMLEEILDHIVMQKYKIFNVTVVRASSPQPADINISEVEELEEDDQESGQHIQKKNKAKRDRKGPTSRSHGSIEQMFEEDWIPSDDEDKNPLDLGLEDDGGADAMSYVLPNGRKSRAKKMKPRLWYDQDIADPKDQFVKHLCFIDVYQFRTTL
ncbi:Ankyrin-3 [Hordeum vulgare]|nr:Ankyrin-3 [Hordeum vulgare]